MFDNDAADGPSAVDLAAIEAEWPRIQAEIDLLSVQIDIAIGHGPVDEVTVRRLYRSRDAVVAEALRWYRDRFNRAQSA